MATDLMHDERIFVKHMLRFFLVRQRKDLTESNVDILMRSTQYSNHFTIDMHNVLALLMTREEVGVLPHPIDSDYFREQLAFLRNNFTLRNFLEYSTRFMTRAVQDFLKQEFTALVSVVDGLVDILEFVKSANIISENFFTDLQNLAVEMVEEDRRNRGIGDREH